MMEIFEANTCGKLASTIEQHWTQLLQGYKLNLPTMIQGRV
jgi:hypothetical protein